MKTQERKKFLNFPIFEFAMLIPIFYSFRVAIDDRDFAQMTVTVGLVASAWIFTIIKSFLKK